MAKLRTPEEIMSSLGLKVKDFENPSNFIKMLDTISASQKEALEAAVKHHRLIIDYASDGGPAYIESVELDENSILNLLP